MSALDHEVEAADVSEGSPPGLGIRPIEELESIGTGNGTQSRDGA